MTYTLLQHTLPLFTTKRMAIKSIIHELLWFLKGSTDGQVLLDKKVNIWRDNGSREFLDSRGLNHYKENDLGPIYGFQWRHFGAEYKDCKSDYSNQGIDQLKEAIETIKSNPNDRRIIVVAWNPSDLKKMALPPCHLFFQFYVEDNRYLDCLMYQRSCDMALGVPFNVTSYSILTHIIAKLTNLEARHFIHTLGNYHVYENHIDNLRKQVELEPKEFPKLEIVDRGQKKVEDFVIDDFIIQDYESHPRIVYDMVV
ncbi:MAG: Thymidylate synthase [Marteilia pararefringens]